MTFPAFDIAEYDTPEFTRYAGPHKESTGPGDARPTALQVVIDNELEGMYRYHCE